MVTPPETARLLWGEVAPIPTLLFRIDRALFCNSICFRSEVLVSFEKSDQPMLPAAVYQSMASPLAPAGSAIAGGFTSVDVARPLAPKFMPVPHSWPFGTMSRATEQFWPPRKPVEDFAHPSRSL